MESKCKDLLVFTGLQESCFRFKDQISALLFALGSSSVSLYRFSAVMWETAESSWDDLVW